MDDNGSVSNCSSSDSLGSASDLVPGCLDLSAGDYSCVNNNLLNVAHYNVNSLTCRTKLEQIGSLGRQINLSVIAISETKLDDNIQDSVFTIPGYNVEYRHRTRKGGGVALYIRDDIPYVRTSKLESNVLEHVSVDATVKDKKFNISVIYRPPSRSTPDQSAAAEDNKFLSEIGKTLGKLRSHRASSKLILGDFNFGDCYDFYGGLNGKSLDDRAPPIFLEKDFYQMVDRPTRKVGNSVSLIDLVFVNKTDDVVLTAVLPPIADHSGTLISLNTLSFKKPPKVITLYDYDTADWEAIESEIPNLSLFQDTDVDVRTNQLTQALIDLRDKYVPHKTVKIHEKDQPWLDKDTRRKLSKKNRSFKIYSKAIDQIKRGNRANNDEQKAKTLFDKYKMAKKDFEYTARSTKQKYFNKLKGTLLNPEISPKKKFTLLNRLTNTGKNANIPPLIDNDKIIHKPKEKAQTFNNHFAKKSNLKGRDETPPTIDPIDTLSDLIHLDTSHHELGPLIKNMKNADFSPCGIPAKFIKLLYQRFGSKITTPIADLLNLIFRTGIYPKIWKVANITPVFKKKGARTDKSNWRPISILPTLSKLCEAVIHDRILRHLLENGIITNKQAAYLPNDSTANQLLYIVHQIKSSWSKKHLSQAVFLDISAAFDAVWHNALIEKLRSINVKGKCLKLLQSYLSERTAKTVVDGQESTELPVEAGVPQGSRLGPLLFILYINDIISDLESEPMIFADDTTLIQSGPDVEFTSLILNRDLAKITIWAKKWKVEFNAGKSKDMIFSKEQPGDNFPLIFQNATIERVSKHKHLGVTLTSSLSWDMHVTNIIKQVNMKLSMIYKVRELNRKTLDIMYKMHVRSCIDYCLPVYGPSLSNTQVNKLDQLQYRAARMATMAMKFTSKEKIFKDLGWESIENRIKYLSLTLFHKIHIHETRPLIRSCMPPINQYQNFTRSNRYYNTYTQKDATFCNSFFPKISNLWNDLPSELRHKGMIDFKTELGWLLKPPKIRLYCIGSKFGNSIHTQLRVNKSQLNDHLFTMRLSNTPSCICSEPLETTEHFILDCFMYEVERQELFTNISGLLIKKLDKYNRHDLVTALLFGENVHDSERYQHNKLLFKNFQNFLIKTKRLCYKSKLQHTINE